MAGEIGGIAPNNGQFGPDHFTVKSRGGTAVDAQFLTYNGNYVLGPDGSPYVVPADFNLEQFMEKYSSLDNQSLTQDYTTLLDNFRQYGSDDLQRSYDGYTATNLDGFVAAFTPAASFIFAVGCENMGISIIESATGGGLYNLRNSLTDPNLDTSGAMFNNPNNFLNIILGYRFMDSIAPIPPIPPGGGDPGGSFGNVSTVDPIVLNLGGNGIITTNIQNGTFFDYNNNGFAEQTAWITAGEGILVTIPSDSNITGQNLLTIQSLSSMDSNGDGVINANDSAWSQLGVWVENSTGTGGQLYTLAQLGITSLNISFTSTGTTDSSGNTQVALGSFTMQDGTIHQMGDYLFQTSTETTIENDLLTVPENIQLLPYLPSYGTVYDSWQAMTRDTSGTLENLIESFANTDNPVTRNNILDQLLYQWTGSENVDPTSRGAYVDAQQLAVLEQFYGQAYFGTGAIGGSDPNFWAGPLLSAQYDNVKEYYDGYLMAQTHLADLFGKINYSFDEAGNTILDMTAVQAQIQSDLATDYQQGKLELKEFVNAAWATGVSTTDVTDYEKFCNYFTSQSDDLAIAVYSAGRNVFSPDSPLGVARNGAGITSDGSGNLTIRGDGANDILIGGAGNDNLYADGGDVVLDGGAGDDTLYGDKDISEYKWGDGSNNGNVTYLWGEDSGNDTIINVGGDTEGTNKGQSIVQLGVGITADSIDWVAYGNDVILKLKDSDATLTIKYWFQNADDQMNIIQFADGSQLTTDQVTSLLIATDVYHTGIISANDYGSIIDGGTDDEVMYGGKGNDTYRWGENSGNDKIYNSPEDNGNDGVDTIQLGAGITIDSIQWSMDNNSDLVLQLKDSGKTLTVMGWFADNRSIQFADGTILTPRLISDLANGVLKSYNSQGMVLDSGTVGGVTMYGDIGDDTYLWGKDSGSMDTIVNAVSLDDNSTTYINPGKDTLQMGPGITADSVEWIRNATSNGEFGSMDDLVLDVNGSFLTIKNWFKRDDYKIATIQFADGTSLTADEITKMVMVAGDPFGSGQMVVPDGGWTVDSGVNGYEYITGGKGNDTYLWGENSGDGDAISKFDTSSVDFISNYQDYGQDTIQLGSGITADSVEWLQSDDDLVLKLKDSGKTLTISDWFYRDDFEIETIRFADGSQLTAQQVTAMATTDIDGVKVLRADDSGSILDSGAAQVLMYGGRGNDTYLWGKDSGNDTIYNAVIPQNLAGVEKVGNDTLKLGAGITADSIDWIGYNAMFGEGIMEDGLVLQLKDSSTKLTIQDWFQGDNYQVGTIEFADGSTMTADQVNNMVIMEDVNGLDSIWATSNGSVIDPGSNDNEAMYGGAGNDTYRWGANGGNDTIYNYYGGQDTLQFGVGVSAASLKYQISDQDLVVLNEVTGKTLTIAGWFNGNNQQIETFQFADGTSYTANQIQTMAEDNLTGTDEKVSTLNDTNETTWALSDTNETIIFGAGANNDTIDCQNANDTLIWGTGSGNDTIVTQPYSWVIPGQETLELGAGLTANSLNYLISGNDLVLQNKTTGETLTISGWYNNSSNQIQTFQFADGTTYTAEQIMSMSALYITGSNETIHGVSGYDETFEFESGASNDLASGKNWNETYIFDSGAINDTEWGGSGNNTILFASGANNDIAETWTGNDTYLWGSGSGNDTIEVGYCSSHGQETLELGAGLTVDSFNYFIRGNDLMLVNKTTSETLTIAGWYNGADHQIKTFQFVDGKSYTAAQISSLSDNYVTGSNEMVWAIDGLDETIELGAGANNVTVNGGNGGNDKFIWGSGSGNDTINTKYYSWNTPGQDTLELGAGLTVDSLDYCISGNDLVLENKVTNETLTIADWNNGTSHQIQTFQFADGSNYTSQQIESMATYFENGNYDTVKALDGADQKIELGSNATKDTILGGSGNDTFIWDVGANNNTINAGNESSHGNYTLQFQNIMEAALEFTKSGSDLVCTNSQNNTSLTISNWGLGSNYQMNQMKFADGTMTASEINLKIA
jgi:hypothetical protein